MNFFRSQQRVIAQLEIAKRKEVFFVAGKGCGKSHLGATMLLVHAMTPGTVTFIGAASETIMGISTFPALKARCKQQQLIEGIHFVVGKLPPDEWNVKPFSASISIRNIITWRWGSYTIFKTLSDPEAVEGAQFDFAWIDEYGLMDIPTVRRMLRDRMRGECYSKLGKKHQMLYTGTPPNKSSQLSELRKIRDEICPKDPEVVMEFGKTTENNTLPPDFIDYNKDPINFRRDYEGSLEMPPTNMWYYNYDRIKHIGERELIDGLFYIWHDFNKNPGTALIIQHSREGKWIHVHDEIYLNGSDLAGVCQMVKSRYPKTHRYILGGDAMGHAGTHLQLGKTSFKVMLKEYGAEERQLIYRKKNPFHSDSNLLTNAILNAQDNVLKLTISSKCVELLKDLELVGMGQDYDFDLPDAGRGHLGDCLRYYLWDNWRDFVKWGK